MNTPVASREAVLLMAMELGNQECKLRFTDLKRAREVTIVAHDVEALKRAMTTAKVKLGLGAESRVLSCYEAGRDGFWLHRCLVSLGVENVVVDSASIEVNRRKRRAKTDRLDAKKLLTMLTRHAIYGERDMWQIVRVPTETQEDERRRHREQERLKGERTGHLSRIRSLLVLHGINVKRLDPKVEQYRDWAHHPLPEAVRGELEREFERLEMVNRQIHTLDEQRDQRAKSGATEGDRATAKLMRVKAIGMETASVLGYEFFGWRKFKNRRQVGSLAGLTGTPYESGDSKREQGISKAGNPRVRHKMIEVAWLWMRYQPGSALTQWFFAHYGPGSHRKRKAGVVALARKLLVALWKYVEFDEIPAGAVLKVA
jgi:transposase